MFNVTSYFLDHEELNKRTPWSNVDIIYAYLKQTLLSFVQTQKGVLHLENLGPFSEYSEDRCCMYQTSNSLAASILNLSNIVLCLDYFARKLRKKKGGGAEETPFCCCFIFTSTTAYMCRCNWAMGLTTWKGVPMPSFHRRGRNPVLFLAKQQDVQILQNHCWAIS